MSLTNDLLLSMSAFGEELVKKLTVAIVENDTVLEYGNSYHVTGNVKLYLPSTVGRIFPSVIRISKKQGATVVIAPDPLDDQIKMIARGQLVTEVEYDIDEPIAISYNNVTKTWTF